MLNQVLLNSSLNAIDVRALLWPEYSRSMVFVSIFHNLARPSLVAVKQYLESLVNTKSHIQNFSEGHLSSRYSSKSALHLWIRTEPSPPLAPKNSESWEKRTFKP